jgi:hypothetical protein
VVVGALVTMDSSSVVTIDSSSVVTIDSSSVVVGATNSGARVRGRGVTMDCSVVVGSM